MDKDYQNTPWCTCNKMGKCIGCMIEEKVKECYGTQGLAFLKAHIEASDGEKGGNK